MLHTFSILAFLIRFIPLMHLFCYHRYIAAMNHRRCSLFLYEFVLFCLASFMGDENIRTAGILYATQRVWSLRLSTIIVLFL